MPRHLDTPPHRWRLHRRLSAWPQTRWTSDIADPMLLTPPFTTHDEEPSATARPLPTPEEVFP